MTKNWLLSFKPPICIDFANSGDVDLLVVNEDGSIRVARTNETLVARSGSIDDEIFQQVFPGFSQAKGKRLVEDFFI